MARPKKYNTPYTGDKEQMEKAFQEYLSCMADCFGEPYDDRDISADYSEDEGNRGPRDSTSLRTVCDEFSISIPKARKLLITAHVYSTEKSRMVAALSAQGRSLTEIMALTGLSRSSVSSYLPYQRFSYNMDECSRHAEDSRKYRERQKSVEKLQEKIKDERKLTVAGEMNSAGINTEELDKTLWQTVIAYQNYTFHTTSGLAFSYTVRQKKNGEYSGELEISCKEKSKTLTRSSVLLAFHKVLEGIKDRELDRSLTFVYSMFWKWGLIQVPGKVEDKLRGKKK